jgi:hypothetical protein
MYFPVMCFFGKQRSLFAAQYYPASHVLIFSESSRRAHNDLRDHRVRTTLPGKLENCLELVLSAYKNFPPEFFADGKPENGLIDLNRLGREKEPTPAHKRLREIRHVLRISISFQSYCMCTCVFSMHVLFCPLKQIPVAQDPDLRQAVWSRLLCRNRI